MWNQTASIIFILRFLYVFRSFLLLTSLTDQPKPICSNWTHISFSSLRHCTRWLKSQIPSESSFQRSGTLQSPLIRRYYFNFSNCDSHFSSYFLPLHFLLQLYERLIPSFFNLSFAEWFKLASLALLSKFFCSQNQTVRALSLILTLSPPISSWTCFNWLHQTFHRG